LHFRKRNKIREEWNKKESKTKFEEDNSKLGERRTRKGKDLYINNRKNNKCKDNTNKILGRRK
jgi:hypothetical protein